VSADASTDLLRHSPYLNGLAERFPNTELLHDILNDVAVAQADDLPKIKARFALAFAQSELLDFDEMGRLWTQFADATIQRALELAWQEAAKHHRLTIPEGTTLGLFILGLGKLGGNDLNFSSDVDLIAFYDADVLPVPKHKGQGHIASDVCKRMTQILYPRNAPDFVWRVDWRLRPESSGTGLATSTAKAETFYFFRALPWHRLALMKARVVAGDYTAGGAFLDHLEPYIWRRNLDFTTLDELAALKARINDEHPGLQNERIAPEPITAKAEGFNIKLGRGGIREIEFIANAQQLIHGGKRPALRVTNTRAALTRLAETGLLSDIDAQTLRADYAHFRRTENAVQMLENQQTHIIPDGDAQTRLRAILGNPSNFDTGMFTRRKRVHERFVSLFKGRAHSTDTIDLANLDETSKRIATRWSEGFTDHGLPIGAHRKFRTLGQALTKRVKQQNRNDAFGTVDDFLKQIGRSEQYFALLDRHPDLLDTLITPLLHSPHMGKILCQSPHIIDIFLSPEDQNLADQSAFVLTSPDYERRLEALRRFVNEQLFYAYTQFLEGRERASDLQTRLTYIAETSLELCLRIVSDDLGVDTLPMTVLGLGKLGTRAMAPESDLDLIFIFSDDCDPELAAKAVRRIRTTLMTKLREGIAYELDMRLRPSGRSGPPAVKLSAFRDHHMQRAHSWEHIALAPARIVAGHQGLGDQVMTIKNEILNRPRDIQAFKEDAWGMFARLSDERLEHVPPTQWNTKLRKGGLMTGDYIRSCFAVIGESSSPNFRDAIEAWETLQIWERLLGLTGRDVKDTPDRFSQQIDVTSLPHRQSALIDRINSEVSTFFKSLGEQVPPEPRPVLWKTSASDK